MNALLDRDAYVRVEYLHDYTGEESKKILYKFNIYIETWRHVKMMRGISVEDAKSLHDALLKSPTTMKLKRGNSSCYEYMDIPKWATKIIATEINRCILS